jgi:integrase
MEKANESRRPRGTGSIYQQPGSRFLWVAYSVNGKLVRESSKSEKLTDAQNLLKKRSGEAETGNLVTSEVRRITVAKLFETLLVEYRNKKQDVVWAKGRWTKHLDPFFGGMRAANVGTRQLAAYIFKRQEEKAANGTINRELSLLQRAFSLGYESDPRTVSHPIRFSRLAESEPRSGFIEQKEYDAMAANCPNLFMRTMLALAYTFGFRKSELLSLKVSDVNLLAGTVQLRDSKNGEPRKVALTDETKKLLTACVTGKGPEDAVFTRGKGTKAVADFRGTWDKVTLAAGCAGLLFHDLRRSAVRSMVRAGIPETVCMRISGHKTRNVFDRYNITSERDLIDAAKRIEKARVIHSSFIVGQENASEAAKENLVSMYNQ